MCVFTTAVRKVDNKFIFEYKRKVLLLTIYFSTFTLCVCRVITARDGGGGKKAEQLWSETVPVWLRSSCSCQTLYYLFYVFEGDGHFFKPSHALELPKSLAKERERKKTRKKDFETKREFGLWNYSDTKRWPCETTWIEPSLIKRHGGVISGLFYKVKKKNENKNIKRHQLL